MNVLIVHAHPEPASFNGALTQRAVTVLRAAGHNVIVSDLHGEGFNPVAGRHDFLEAADASRFHYQSEQAHAAQTQTFAPDIRREQVRLAAADLLILQFPLWWGAPPAILKGWFERVLAYGFAYVEARRFESGLFKGRRAIISVTTGGTPQRFSSGDVYGPISDVLRSVEKLTLHYMGYEVEEPFVAYAAPRVSEAERKIYLDEWERRVLSAAAAAVPAPPIDPDAALASVSAGAWARS